MLVSGLTLSPMTSGCQGEFFALPPPFLIWPLPLCHSDHPHSPRLPSRHEARREWRVECLESSAMSHAERGQRGTGFLPGV